MEQTINPILDEQQNQNPPQENQDSELPNVNNKKVIAGIAIAFMLLSFFVIPSLQTFWGKGVTFFELRELASGRMTGEGLIFAIIWFILLLTPFLEFYIFCLTNRIGRSGWILTVMQLISLFVIYRQLGSGTSPFTTGFYFYLIATLVLFFLPRFHGENPITVDKIKKVFAKPITLTDNLERKWFGGGAADYKPLVSKAVLGAIVVTIVYFFVLRFRVIYILYLLWIAVFVFFLLPIYKSEQSIAKKVFYTIFAIVTFFVWMLLICTFICFIMIL